MAKLRIKDEEIDPTFLVRRTAKSHDKEIVAGRCAELKLLMQPIFYRTKREMQYPMIL